MGIRTQQATISIAPRILWHAGSFRNRALYPASNGLERRYIPGSCCRERRSGRIAKLASTVIGFSDRHVGIHSDDGYDIALVP